MFTCFIIFLMTEIYVCRPVTDFPEKVPHDLIIKTVSDGRFNSYDDLFIWKQQLKNVLLKQKKKVTQKQTI